MSIAVIGGGAFGVMCAIRLAEDGQRVSLFERLPDLMLGVTVNANRVHQGYHYPRDPETARQCRRGYQAFRQDFEAAMLPGVTNSYFIANERSLTSPDEFLAACRRNGLPYRVIDPAKYEPAVRNVSLGVETDEPMYDPAALRRLMIERLHAAGVTIHVGAAVADISRSVGGGFSISLADGSAAQFDAVVNCSYAEVNRLTARLGHEIETHHFEYVAVPVVEVNWPSPKSITVLDGLFACLLPFGAGRENLLYHVINCVIAESDSALLDRRWLDPATSPFAAVDTSRWYEAHLRECCEFVPALRDCRLAGIVQGPRVVFADRAATDGRPSRVTQHEPGYITVFSGKIDHCPWVADDVAESARRQRGRTARIAGPQERDVSAPIELRRHDVPRVSVIVTSSARLDLLQPCLRSLARAGPSTIPYETIVVLNRNTPEIEAQLRTMATGIRIVSSPVNLGIAGSSNRGRHVARGELLLLLHDDAEVEPGWMEALVATADAHPEAGAIGGKVLFPDGELQDAGKILWSDASTTSPWVGHTPSPDAFDQLRAVDYCGTSSLMVRASAWDRIGGADERFHPAYFVDVDLCMAIRQIGLCVLYQPASCIRHRRRSSTTSYFTPFLVQRNRQLFIEKWGAVLDEFEAPVPNSAAAVERAIARAQTAAERARGAPTGDSVTVPRNPFDPDEQDRRLLDRDREVREAYVRHLERALGQTEGDLKRLMRSRSMLLRQFAKRLFFGKTTARE